MQTAAAARKRVRCAGKRWEGEGYLVRFRPGHGGAGGGGRTGSRVSGSVRIGVGGRRGEAGGGGTRRDAAPEREGLQLGALGARPRGAFRQPEVGGGRLKLWAA